MKTVFLGTRYGGFHLPTNCALRDDSIVYNFGVGEDISFDVALVENFGCKVHLFDPTPRAIDHVKLIKEALKTKTGLIPENNKRYGGGDPKYLTNIFSSNIKHDKLQMHDYGLFTHSGTVSFYAPKNKEHVSYSIETQMKNNANDDYMMIYVKDIETIMKSFGHTTIDLLKIDIEGVECEVLMQMMDKNIFPRYLCVDFDARRSNIKVEEYTSCISRLRKHYKVIKNDNYDISFEKLVL